MNGANDQATSSPEQNTPVPMQEKNGMSRDIAFGLGELVFVIVALVVFFGVLNYFQILPVSSTIPFLSFLPQKSSQTSTTQPQQSSQLPSNTVITPGKLPFVGDQNLPYPMNLPAVSSVRVAYVIDGHIKEITTDPSKSDYLLLTIRALNGTKFTDPISVKSDFIVGAVTGVAKERAFSEKPVNQMKNGDRLIVTLVYEYPSKQLYVQTLQSIKEL